MARLPRYVLPGQAQHIIQRGNNRQVIFASDTDFQCIRDAMVSASDQHGLAIHAYVWMGNHIHLLATPGHEQSISKVFQSVGRKFAVFQPHLPAHRQPLGRSLSGDGGGQ